MTDTTLTGTPVVTEGDISLYRAIWRWHFFAGLLVIPFMLNLAVTGGLYLFKDEINDTFFAYRNVVADTGANFAPSAIVSAAEAAVPGSSASAYREAPDATHSAMVTVSSDAGGTLVFVNPHDAKVLGHVASDNEFNWVVKKIHSLEYFGTYANRLVEIVGGFALMLVVTGIYLWWPRRQTGGVLSVRGTPSKRVFWRDMHAVTGAVAGIMIFFLAVTGMPWSGYWGDSANTWLTANGYGYPAELWDAVPTSSKATHHTVDQPGWVVENAPVPESTMDMAHMHAQPIGLDAAVVIARKAGIAPGFEMALPDDDKGVYTASVYPDDLSRERTMHIDQFSGKPLVDISYGQYARAGRMIEWGINVHQGQEWGLFNQLLMLATCLCIVLMCVSGAVMWWKRRPSGRLGVPPAPPRGGVYIGLWAIAAVFGLAFPMTGMAIIVMVLLDQTVLRFIPPLRRRFS
ncbi:PepSY domain-containing protein [Rhizobium sp. TH2]|uniref:PepSY-associated TM helix domain-containing protein n=1 Tax=Rhizobium sp. TH2 TaxID=2775403 RepID=UPI0021577712|nr:PepSY domain-containing protein [Rhizobium sp. TH2]UVC07794.1 PepSY domain-containing protein [Rhizobium sp. TH2]